jgi:hypothetical protein
MIDLEDMQRFISKYDPIVALGRDINQEALNYLRQLKLTRIALASFAKNREQLKALQSIANIASSLDFKKTEIINCLAQPFKKYTQVETRVGVGSAREKTRLDKSLEKIEKLKALDNFFDRKKK